MQRGSGRWLLILLGLFGTALLYGDGVITPAISVLSAVEGFEVATPLFEPFVLPITIGILVALFAAQRFGTAGVGRVFGPVTLLWFVTLAVLGVAQIVRAPEVLGAINPGHAVSFFVENGPRGFLVLGSVFLVVTGGKRSTPTWGTSASSRSAWCGLWPCCPRWSSTTSVRGR